MDNASYDTSDSARKGAWFSRLHGVLKAVSAIARNKSVCWLNDADRAKSASSLDDAEFLTWGRWAVSVAGAAWAKDANRREQDFQEVLVMHSVIALANLAIKLGGQKLQADVSGAYQGDAMLGDWRVIIERLATPRDPSEGGV